eukprot:Skav225538  [mRNA]  locus=scaffold339:21936:22793:- [translate_table: standard]
MVGGMARGIAGALGGGGASAEACAAPRFDAMPAAAAATPSVATTSGGSPKGRGKGGAAKPPAPKPTAPATSNTAPSTAAGLVHGVPVSEEGAQSARDYTQVPK